MISNYLKYINNIMLINHDNKHKYIHDILKNNIVIISMFYSNCKGKCIPLGKHLYKCYKFIGEDIIKKKNIHFLHITLDPLNDTIYDINQFKEMCGCNNTINWDFVTGNPTELENLRLSLGMYDPDKNVDKIKEKHSGMSIVINEKMNTKVMLRAYENSINQARKIFSICMPEFYSKTGYKILKQINYNFSKDFENSLFNDIHSIHPIHTLPFLPDKYKIIFKTKSLDYINNNLKYDPYIEYGLEYKFNKCCCKT